MSDSPSIRDAIEKAMDTDEEEAEAPAPEPVAEAAPVEALPEPSKARDESGRFAKKAKAPEVQPGVIAPEQAQKSVAQVQAPETAPEVRAPQSLRPIAREAWAKLPPEFKPLQDEFARREIETSRALNESAEARQFAEQFQEVVSPFLPMIQADGGDALGAIENLFQTAAALRTGHPAQRAQVAAQMIRQFGIDVRMLDQALTGQAPRQGVPQAPMQDPRVDELLAKLDEAEARRSETIKAKYDGEVASFSQGKEFFEDVREDMADLMEVAKKRGVALSLEDAYNRAVQMHPEIAEVLSQRKAAAGAGNVQASTQRAKAASSSVRSTPISAPGGAPPSNMREQIEAAIEAASGR